MILDSNIFGELSSDTDSVRSGDKKLPPVYDTQQGWNSSLRSADLFKFAVNFYKLLYKSF